MYYKEDVSFVEYKHFQVTQNQLFSHSLNDVLQSTWGCNYKQAFITM